MIRKFDKKDFIFKIAGKELDFSDSRKITIKKEASCIDTIEVEFFLETQKIKVDENARLYFIVGNKKYIVKEIENVEEIKND